MNNQDGYIFGHPIDGVLSVVNVAYLLAVGLAAVLSVAIFLLAARSGAAKDRAFEKYKQSADLQIADANSRANLADEKAANAATLVAQANEEIARLNLADTQLKAQNLALEAQIAPRRIISFDQRLYDSLGRLAPKTIKLTSYALDPDGAVLATQMYDGLKSQNFSIQDFRMTQGPSTGLAFGVWIFGPDKALVATLVAFFKSAGLLVFEQEPQLGSGVAFNTPMPTATPPDASIFIGLKPLPGMAAP